MTSSVVPKAHRPSSGVRAAQNPPFEIEFLELDLGSRRPGLDDKALVQGAGPSEIRRVNPNPVLPFARVGPIGGLLLVRSLDGGRIVNVDLPPL